MAKSAKGQGSADQSSKVWSLLSGAAWLAGTLLAKRALAATWRLGTGKAPPGNASDPDLRLREAVAWATLSGTVIALARMLATRKAADYYIRSTGKVPADLGRPASDAASTVTAPP